MRDSPVSVSKAPSGTILLVEDEIAVRELVRAILNTRGYNVLVAENASHAADICQKHQQSIDVLLTDVVMPEVTGPELAKRLHALRPEMRVIYMTGYAGESLAEQGLLVENVVALQKPFTAAALEEKIELVLRRPLPLF